jgi:hypothetical protein
MTSGASLEIPSFKASFGSIDWQTPILLKVVGKKRIRSIQAVNEELARVFVAFLKKRGRRADIIDYRRLLYEGETYEGRKAHRRYLISQIYSLAIPTCLNLGLLSQQEDQEMLTFFGRKLLDVLNRKDCDFIHESKEVMELLKEIALYEDKKHWRIMDSLSKSASGWSITELITQLEGQGVSISVSKSAIERIIRKKYLSMQEERGSLKTWRDRERLLGQLEMSVKESVEKRVQGAKISKVRSLLGIMCSLGLIEKKGEIYRMASQRLREIGKPAPWLESANVTESTFFKALKQEYDAFPSDKKYVQMPLLRDSVCWNLQIPWDVFDEKLSSLGYEYANYRIALIPPITSKVWGIFKGRKNFYYVSIEENYDA